MTVPAAQREVAAFLQALSDAPASETHISMVFVGADFVWKLKKAVRLRFLDFTDVADRRRFAERELALNGPVAPGLYRDVVPVLRGPDGGLALGDAEDGKSDAAAVDWVLRMAKVPPEDFLDAMAAAGRIDAALLDAAADAVAAYHAACPRLRPARDQAAAMREVVLGNEAAALDAGLPASRVAAWRARCAAALDALADWQRGRLQDGFVRRGHGDLHLGNLCLWRGMPVPFDALEFDESLATIDVGYDLAFLLMDCERRIDRLAANRLFNRYVARTGDAAAVAGLPAFLSLRALVRAHVEASRGNDVDAAAYLDAAEAYLDPAPAALVAIGGLQGTGKSTLARALAPGLGRAPGALVLRSDEIRKRRWGVAPEAALPSEAYAPAESNGVFAELAALAAAALRGGQSVIADATFLEPATRRQIEAAAAGVPFIGLWLDAPLPVLEARVAARVCDASDATVAVLQASAQSATATGAGDWVTVDAQSAAAAEAAAREALRSRLGAC